MRESGGPGLWPIVALNEACRDMCPPHSRYDGGLPVFPLPAHTFCYIRDFPAVLMVYIWYTLA
jgi:hypothetical protein